jgi:hypothetical protein
MIDPFNCFLMFLSFFVLLVVALRRLERGPRPWGWSAQKSMLALAMSRGGFICASALSSRETALMAGWLAGGLFVEAVGYDWGGHSVAGYKITEAGKARLAIS